MSVNLVCSPESEVYQQLDDEEGDNEPYVQDTQVLASLLPCPWAFG